MKECRPAYKAGFCCVASVAGLIAV